MQRSTRAAPSGIAVVDASLALRAGEITGIAGVSGNGQSAIAGLIAGTLAPALRHAARHGSNHRQAGRRARRSPTASAASPRTGTPTGMIGDMSVTENVISESYRIAALQPPRLARLDRGARLRRHR